MNYGLVPLLTQSRRRKFAVVQAEAGRHQADSATCGNDLEGMVGNTVACSAVTAGQTSPDIVTVTAVQGDNITYKYVPAS